MIILNLVIHIFALSNKLIKCIRSFRFWCISFFLLAFAVNSIVFHPHSLKHIFMFLIIKIIISKPIYFVVKLFFNIIALAISLLAGPFNAFFFDNLHPCYSFSQSFQKAVLWISYIFRRELNAS